MNITNSNFSIGDILGMLDRRDLTVNSTYQRGSGIWPQGASSYFIDTILEGFPFPKIYMFEYVDRTTRGVRKELVDGQQRLNTIKRFIENELSLVGETNFAGLRYRDLDHDTQDNFLSYTISADVIRNASRTQILQMFRRMNAYTLPLNEAEKRHSSFQGEFKWFVNNLADEFNEMFLEFGVFTPREIVRMNDAALITDSILAMETGIVSTSPTNLRELYRNYNERFAAAGDYHERITEAMNFIIQHLADLRRTHMMKPYALHSLITALIHNRYGIDAIINDMGIQPIGSFANDPESAADTILAIAQAHEAKESDGPYANYLWGCEQSTHRRERRAARVTSLLQALGAEVPDHNYADTA